MDEEQQEQKRRGRPPKDESVSISRADYDLLMNQVRDLARQVKDNQSGVIDIERTKEHVCCLRQWDGKIVVNNTKSWSELDQKTGEKIPYIGIYLQEAEEPVSVKLIDFYRNSSLLEVKIKEELVEEVVEKFGTTEVKTVDYERSKTIGTGVRVPLKVVSQVKKYVVILPDGSELTIPECAIN